MAGSATPLHCSTVTAPALLIQDLEFAFQGAPLAWNVPHLQLDAGEQVLLTGGSGQGKSTLLQLIAGLRDPQRGEVHVGGVNLTQLRGAARDKARGQHIGVVFQTFNLLPGFSALENVLMAMMFGSLPTAHHEARAHELLQSLGMHQEDQDVASLSVGQQQRVAVARALACRPELVLADEPTASLDPQNATLALDLLQDACRAAGAALLCTSHDPSIRSRFPRIESMETFVRQMQKVETP